MPARLITQDTRDAYPGQIHSPVDFDVLKLRIKDKDATDELASAIIDGDLLETMEGASTLSLTVHDPNRRLVKDLVSGWVRVNPDTFETVNGHRRRVKYSTQWSDVYCSLDRRDFALVNLTKSANDFTLSLENRAIHELRKYQRARSFYRDVMTRAMAIKALIDEVPGYVIDFYCPELDTKQHIQLAASRPTSVTKARKKKQGFAKAARITVKGAIASPQQISIIDRVLTTGQSMNAPYKVLVCSIMTITDESNVSLLNEPGGYGPFSQLRNGAWPASVTDVEADAAAFFRVAMQVNAQNPTLAFGALCHAVQRNADPHVYDQFEGEAKRTLSLWGTSATTGSVSYQEYSRYAFQRGQQGQRENSWDAGTRWAQEVNWRLFAVDNTIYYIDDFRLFAQKPYDTISETDDGIDEINYDLDSGKRVNTCTVLAHFNRWQAPPGSVIVIDNDPIVEGRWLVHSIERQSIFRNAVEITLQLPSQPLSEPAPETSSVSINVPNIQKLKPLSGEITKALQTVPKSVPGHPELKPGVSQIVNIIRAKFPDLTITSTFRAGGSSYHALGRACDLGTSTPYSQMDPMGKWIAANLGVALVEGIHNPTLSIANGASVPASHWGADTWAQHVNHIHVAV